jgi:opacity protein-like surface antigen
VSKLSRTHSSLKILPYILAVLPEFENYTYSLKLNTIRIMANADLDFHPIRASLIPFIQGGLGAARTTVSYSSVPISPVISPDFTLPVQASWHMAYQLGAGAKYAVKPHLVLSLRYLYAAWVKLIEAFGQHNNVGNTVDRT